VSDDQTSATHQSLLRQARLGFVLGQPERAIGFLEAFLALGPVPRAQKTACAQFLPEIEERLARIPDLPRSERERLIAELRLATAGASARRSFRSGLESMRGGAPPVRRTISEPPGSELVRRTPHLVVDSPLQPGASFQVQVYLDTQAARAGEDSEDVVVPAGTQVEVHLVVSSHFVVSGETMRTMTVRGDVERSEAPPFELAVKLADALRAGVPPLITALFFHNGRPSGKVTRAVTIVGLAAAAAPAGRPARVELQEARMPDLSITIRATEAHDGRQFECILSTPLLDAYKSPLTTSWNLPGAAEQLVRGHMQAFTKKQPVPGALVAELRGAGIVLFEAAPQSFRKLFWELVDAKKLPREIAIVSEEPYIPWELMIPRRRVANGDMETRKPLGVEFPIGRWIPPDFVAGRTRIPLTDSYVISPKYANPRQVLKFSDAERMLLMQKFDAEPISPVTFAQIAEKLTSSGRSLVHFVCHGKDGDGGRQILQLENNEELSSTQLLGIEGLERVFAQKRPFVFLNACEVGRTTAALVGLGGFATSFIDLGASAVIAPLWSVKDDIAHQVAETFYGSVKSEPGTTFAEIMRRLRAKAYENNSAEDTYAAYCFYGDPCATC
jgi:CHAT domain